MKIRVLIKTICLFSWGLMLSSESVEQPPRLEKVQRLVSEVSNISPIGRTYTYDDRGRLIKTVLDFDGIADELDGFYTYTYDDETRLLTRSQHDPKKFDEPFRVATFNEFGDIIKTEFNREPGDDQVNTSTYTYDVEGRKLTEERDNNNDGADVFFDYTYERNKVIERIDRTRPGFEDSVTIYIYDDRGNLIRTDEADENLVVTRSKNFTSYIYDDNNINIITIINDIIGDGSLERITNYVWEEFEILVD